MYEILPEELVLCRWREATLEALEKVATREDQAWINHHKPGKPNYLPILISISVKDVVCKSNSKLVTPDPRLQGCIVLYISDCGYSKYTGYKKKGKKNMLWTFTVQRFRFSNKEGSIQLITNLCLMAISVLTDWEKEQVTNKWFTVSSVALHKQ